MSDIYIKVEVYGGVPIERAAGEACVLARHLGCNVEFEFNGVTCMAKPWGSSAVLVENWYAAVKEGSRYPMASTDRPTEQRPGNPHA
jgi:hypothetical protein